MSSKIPVAIENLFLIIKSIIWGILLLISLGSIYNSTIKILEIFTNAWTGNQTYNSLLKIESEFKECWESSRPISESNIITPEEARAELKRRAKLKDINKRIEQLIKEKCNNCNLSFTAPSNSAALNVSLKELNKLKNELQSIIHFDNHVILKILRQLLNIILSLYITYCLVMFKTIGWKGILTNLLMTGIFVVSISEDIIPVLLYAFIVYPPLIMLSYKYKFNLVKSLTCQSQSKEGRMEGKSRGAHTI